MTKNNLVFKKNPSYFKSLLSGVLGGVLLILLMPILVFLLLAVALILPVMGIAGYLMLEKKG
jgi:hypothetical protein